MSWFNPPAANINLPSYVTPQGFGATYPSPTTSAPGGNIDPNAVAGQYYGGIGGLGGYNTYGQLLPQAMGIGQGMVGDPSAYGAMAGANIGAGYGLGGAANAYGAGSSLYGLAPSIMQQAFDPQSALYNQLYGQTQQQNLAALSNAGLATSPYGQGVLGNTMNNFNINWQNAQLQRMLQGANTVNQMMPTAAQLQAGAVPLAAQSAALPWMTGQQIGGANLGTLGTLGGFGTSATQIPNQQLQDYFNLMGWGTGAQQQAFGQNQLANFTDPSMLAASANAFNQQNFRNAMQQQQIAGAQQQAMFGGLGTIAGAGLGSFLGPAGMLMGAQIGSGLGGGGMPSGGGMPGSGGNMFSGLPGGGWNWNFFQPQQASTPLGFKYGGDPTPWQPTIVGEAGPEVFVPHTSGTIIPNQQTQQQGMGGMGGMGGLPGLGGQPGDLPASPYPMPGVSSPYSTGMGGIGAMGDNFGFKRDQGHGWNMSYGGPS